MTTKTNNKNLDIEDFKKLLKNLPFAKLVLRDNNTNRILFASHHEEDSRIWWPDGRCGRLGQLAYSTTVEAMKSKSGEWEWVGVSEIIPAPGPKVPPMKPQERSTPVNRRFLNMEKAQEIISKKREVKQKSETVANVPDDFVSLRVLSRGNLKGQATYGHFLTIRKNGKFIFSKEMRGVLTQFDIEISPSSQKVRIVPGKGEYRMNKSGCFCSKGGVEVLKTLEGETARRVYLELSSDDQMWYGDFSKSAATYRR